MSKGYILCDAANWMHRGYHVAPELQSKGRKTGALFVSLSMLATLGDLVSHQSVIFLWDSYPSWRKTFVPEYKQSRNYSEDNADRKALYAQMGVFQNLLSAVGVRQFKSPNLEADDLAGILTEMFVRKGKEVILVSSDKDWYQLLQPGVTQLRGWKGKVGDWWTAERVEKELGVKPSNWVEYLALLGKKNDVPKALRRGAGEKVAIKYLTGEYKLLPEEETQFLMNLRVTRVMRGLPKHKLQQAAIPFLKNREQFGWAVLEATLKEYEFHSIWGERKRIWEVGKW